MKDPRAARIFSFVDNGTNGTIYFDAVRFEERGITTSYEYDSIGNYVASQTEEEGNVTRYTLDGRGNVKRVDSPRTGAYETYEYDALDRVTASEDSSNLRVETLYDAIGNPYEYDYYDKTSGTPVLKSKIQKAYNELSEIRRHGISRMMFPAT